MRSERATRQPFGSAACLGRAAGRLAGALAAAALLGGCIDSPHEQSGGGSALGAWELVSTPTCAQHLSIAASGRFTLAAWVTQGTLAGVEQVDGTVSPAPRTGAFAAQFSLDDPLPAGAGPYCGQWNASAQLTLPLGSAAAGIGADATTLVYTPSSLPGVGTVFTATDPARRDRMIVIADGSGTVSAFRADDPASFPSGIFRALPGDPAPADTAYPGALLMAAPGDFYARSFTGTTGGASLQRIVIRVAAASDLTFSNFAGSSVSTCTFVAFQDTFFASPATGVLAAGAASQTVTFNPAEPGWPLPTATLGGVTVYLLPVEVRSPADGDCEAYISIQSVSERVAAQQIAAGGPALFTASFPAGSQLLGHRPGIPGRQERVPIDASAAARGAIVLSGSAVTLPGPRGLAGLPGAQDPLHLTGPPGAASFISVSAAAGGRRLSIFPDSGAHSGLGPFVPMASDAGETLAIPDVRAIPGATGSTSHAYLLHVPAAVRAAFWTDGGVATRGHLIDAAGRTLALSAGGAVDLAGFRIEADLAPGDYTLRVAADAGPFTMNSAVLGSPADFADAGLEACLVEAGWAQYPGTPVTAAWCARRGIRQLIGIDLAATLTTLDLSGNAVARIDGVESLAALDTLLLESNPLVDLTPLASIPHLRRLSLAGTPLTSASLPILQSLAATLAFLDLTGVTTLTGAQVDALHAALPFTTMVGPSGAILP